MWFISALLLIVWVLVWGFQLAGSSVHVLLLIAVVLAVLNLLALRPRAKKT